MALSFLRHQWQKVAASVSLIILLLVLIPALLINRYWSPVLAVKLKQAVLTGTDSLYRVNFRDAELHILQGKIVIHDIDLEPDSSVYNRRIKQGLAPNNLYRLKLKKLVITRMHPFSLYFKHKLTIGKIILSAPELKVSYRLTHTKDTVVKDKRTPWQMIAGTLKIIRVGEILLNDVNFKYQDHTAPTAPISELKGMNLRAVDLLIDSATQTDKTRLLYCRNIIAELYNYTGKTPNGLYTYRINEARLSTLTSRLEVTGLQLQPVLPGVFFGKSNSDRMTLHLDTAQLNHFDYLNYGRYRTFNAANLILSRGVFSVYSNPKSIIKKTDRIITFPHVAIRHIKAAFNLDTLTVKHLSLVYNEHKVGAAQTGTLTFNNTNGHFFNISNNPGSLKRNNLTSARLTTFFMDKGRLDVAFTFNLTDSLNSYTYRGKLGDMDLKLLNKATVPMALVKITSGRVTGLDFNIRSTNKISAGTVKLLYSNLKVNLLRKDSTKEKGYSKKGMASFFANNVVLSRSNPDKPGDVPRSAFISYERPANSPFFKTIWQTLLSGIKPCVGLGKEKEAQVKVRMKEHEKRKAERMRKRAAKKHQ